MCPMLCRAFTDRGKSDLKARVVRTVPTARLSARFGAVEFQDKSRVAAVLLGS